MAKAGKTVGQGAVTPAKAFSGGIQPSSTPTGISQTPANPPQIPDHQLLKCIGRGSYGEVWLAKSITGAYRAVKIVYRSSFDSDRPYHREFEGLQKFEPVSRSHESQVDVLHVGQGEGYFYYVMELADDAAGENPKSETGYPKEIRNPNDGLAQTNESVQDSGFDIPSAFGIPHSDLYTPRTLKLELQRQGRLPFSECVKIGMGLTTALEHLHKHGLIHRDIKPSNIIFIDGQPKLADIGLIANVDATCSFVGTEGYLPPEGPGTPQADLYSLGKVLYEISTGKDRRDFPELPLNLDSPEETRGMMELNAVVVKACKQKAEQRYQSASEMHRDLLLLLAGRSVRQTHDLERRLALAKRIAVATVAVMVLGVVPYFLAIKGARQARREASHAQLAEADSKEKLWRSYLSQAQAGRFSHQMGRRFDGLALLTKAAAIRPSLELRNEAIACLALPDLQEVKQWEGLLDAKDVPAFDFQGGRYARMDDQGNLSIRRIADDHELMRLEGPSAASFALGFSPDGRFLLAYHATIPRQLKIWDTLLGKAVFERTNLNVYRFDFSPNSRSVAIGYAKDGGIL